MLTLPQQALDALLTHYKGQGGFPEDPLFTSSRGIVKLTGISRASVYRALAD